MESFGFQTRPAHPTVAAALQERPCTALHPHLVEPRVLLQTFSYACSWNMADCVTRASSGKGCLVAVGTHSHTGTEPPRAPALQAW
jgi:hypothetical protein